MVHWQHDYIRARASERCRPRPDRRGRSLDHKPRDRAHPGALAAVREGPTGASAGAPAALKTTNQPRRAGHHPLTPHGPDHARPGNAAGNRGFSAR